MWIDLTEEQIKNLVALIDKSQFPGVYAQKIVDLKEALLLPALKPEAKKEQR